MVRAISIFRRIADDRGSNVVEFGLVLLPFLLVVVTIIEVSLTLVSQQVLDTRTADAARLISRGGISGLNASQAAEAVKNTVCNGTVVPFFSSGTCRANLLIGLQDVTGSTPIPPAITGGATNSAAFSITATGGSSILLLRTGLVMPAMSTFWNSAMNNLGNGRRLLTSGAITKVDPYAEYNTSGSSSPPEF
ncbi:TadE/TadG family type IV pilus assembly protein [Xanthobacter sp. DSM 14520]|uniref:TadE/TadG family type IV pilus assembly protein n=1 Tax=Xanthobacter autotrophicus (strain ATCC BAA-1158 / Py2) TaxID=78245 RepID=UPI00372CC8DC